MGKLNKLSQVQVTSLKHQLLKYQKVIRQNILDFGKIGKRRVGHWAEVLLDMFQTYKKNKKKKASLSSALCSDKFLESSFDELNPTSSSAQSLIGGSSPTRYESLSGEGMESMQTGLGSQISTQTVRKQLKANLKLSDSAANHLIDMQWAFP